MGISQNKPFNNQPNIRKGAGPLNYKWSALPFEKKGRGRGGENNTVQPSNVKCDNIIDNVTTYVYNVLPNGDHLAYVYCDYVV